MAGVAARAQEMWRCPNAGFAEPTPLDEPLPTECNGALKAVENLTGACGFRTCPRWYTEQPWIGEALAAWRAESKGQIRERVGWPTLVLYQAVETVDASFNARKRHDLEAMRKKNADEDDDE